jgi:hypothetical protein
MKPDYEPLPTSADLSEASLQYAMDTLLTDGPPKDGLTLRVSMELFDEQASWLPVINGDWTRGVPVAVHSHPDLQRREWYLMDPFHHRCVGSNPP